MLFSFPERDERKKSQAILTFCSRQRGCMQSCQGQHRISDLATAIFDFARSAISMGFCLERHQGPTGKRLLS